MERIKLYVFKHLRHLLFQNCFDLSDGQFKFFGKSLKTYAVNEPTLHNGSVALGENPLVYDVFDLTHREIAKVNHFLRFTPLLLPYLRLRVRVLVLVVVLVIFTRCPIDKITA